jgi:hypothetical protein
MAYLWIEATPARKLFDQLEAYKCTTEYRQTFSDPEAKRLKGYENFEKNRFGRKAYLPEKDTIAVEGISWFISEI